MARLGIDLFGQLNVVPNSNLPGIRFFVYCICIMMWHSHLNDMEIPETKRGREGSSFMERGAIVEFFIEGGRHVFFLLVF